MEKTGDARNVTGLGWTALFQSSREGEHMPRQTIEIKDTPDEPNLSQAELDILFESIRESGFNIDDDNDPRSTTCQVFLEPDTDEGTELFNGKFEITLVVNGLIFTFHNAQAERVYPLLPKAKPVAIVIPLRPMEQ
jgi:hypothetical protein